jgi:hypothetical protein
MKTMLFTISEYRNDRRLLKLDAEMVTRSVGGSPCGFSACNLVASFLTSQNFGSHEFVL